MSKAAAKLLRDAARMPRTFVNEPANPGDDSQPLSEIEPRMMPLPAVISLRKLGVSPYESPRAEARAPAGLSSPAVLSVLASMSGQRRGNSSLGIATRAEID